MVIDLKTLVPAALTLWILVKKWVAEFSKIADPLIMEAERLAADGTIGKEDRKRLVWCALLSLEKQGKIKLNFVTRIVAIKLIDRLAEKLPDFVVTKDARELLTRNDKPAA